MRVYDPATNNWQLLAPCRPVVHGAAWPDGAVVNDKIYAIGGDETLSPPYLSVN